MITRLAAAQAGDAHWGLAVKSCLQSMASVAATANFGVLYATEAMAADLPSMVTFLRETTPVTDWVGAVGHAVFGPAGVMRQGPGLTMLMGQLDPRSLRFADHFDAGDADGFRADHGAWLDCQSMVTGLVHGDPGDPAIAGRVSGLARAAPAFLVGGLSAVPGSGGQVCGRVQKGGLSGVLLGDGVPLLTGLTQGCVPIGEGHRITEAVEDVIMALDGKPAVAVLKEEVGEIIARDLHRAAGYIHVARPVEGSDGQDYVVRSLLGIDPRRGWLAIGDRLATGDRLLFVRRDPNAARQDMARMLDDMAGRLAGRPVRGGLYISCVGRGALMFGHDQREMKMIQEALGSFPLIGFSASGEICHDRLYGYTGVLALFL